MTAKTREQWLDEAVGELRPLFKAAGFDVPRKVRVSVGWPGGKNPLKVIGQCWASSTAGDGSANIYISPLLEKPDVVLSTLVHELVHAVDDCKSQHKGAFIRIAKSVGLTGKWTATVAGPDLEARLKDTAKVLGKYPHSAVTPATKEVKQTTRMLKLECGQTGYLVRTTRKWIDELGCPICPCCGAVMEEAA